MNIIWWLSIIFFSRARAISFQLNNRPYKKTLNRSVRTTKWRLIESKFGIQLVTITICGRSDTHAKFQFLSSSLSLDFFSNNSWGFRRCATAARGVKNNSNSFKFLAHLLELSFPKKNWNSRVSFTIESNQTQHDSHTAERERRHIKVNFDFSHFLGPRRISTWTENEHHNSMW